MIKGAAIWAQPWADLPTPGGSVHFSHGRISDVKPTDPAGDLMLVPGMINAHDHGRGLAPLAYGAPDAALEPWLWDLQRAPQVDVYLSHVVAFAEMVRSGITTVVHNHIPQSANLLDEARQVARAARTVGLRLAMVVPIIDRNLAGYDGGRAVLAALTADEQAQLNAANAMPPVTEQIAMVHDIANAIDGPDIITQYGPPGPQWLSRTGWEQVGDAAQDGHRLHTHLLETRAQRAWLDHEDPGGAATFFATAGVLNDRLTVAHGVWLRPDELSAFANAGVTLSLNASSNLRLRSGIANGANIARSGINFGLGLDGMALDDDNDIWREFRLAEGLFGQNELTGDGLSQTALLRAVFSAGCRAFDGCDAQGLVPDGAADVVAISLSSVTADQIDPTPKVTAASVLGRTTRADVRHVVIAGREVVRNGQVTGLDLPAARAELTAQARAAFTATSDSGWIDKARAATVQKYRTAR